MVKLFESPFKHVNYCLVKSKEEHARFCARHKVAKNEFMSLGKQGQSSMFECGDVTLVIVQVDKASCLEQFTKAQIVGILVHEAVHIWQEIRTAMGEDEPSSEFEAYSIERISEDLISEWGDGE